MTELTPEHWERVQTIFERAADLTDGARRSYLDEACADDTALRREVESLLATDDGVDGFLARPARGVSDAPIPAPTGIDRYRIIEQIGGGGMGEVYRAERADGTYEHHVAIKVLRRDLGGIKFARRFQRERQVLADLDHPGIARLLDGGTTDDDRPWLAMEFVDGVPIDRYCAEHDLDVEARLRLVLRVGAALEHAHRNLVIHRDIKPGNVLVADDGTPRVIDFGIALPLALGDAATMRTTGDEILGTIAYMSPEQCTRGAGAALDVRSDVYALGVMLYELLTGHRPHDVRTLTLVRAIEVITKEPVPRPSSLVPALRGDLDVILMKALEKDPEARYPSVQAFMADIERFLRSEPIEARPPGAIYVAGKFVRRHRVGVAIATAVAVALVATASIAVTAALRASRERERADDRAAAAEFRAYAADLTAAGAMTANDPRAFRPLEAKRLLDAMPEERHTRWEWAHLRSRCEPAVWSVLDAAPGQAVVFSPDGARLVTSLSTRADDLVIRDTARGTRLMSFGGPHERPVQVAALAWSADGRLIAAVGSKDGSVRVWAVDDSVPQQVAALEAPEQKLRAVAFAPDGDHVYVGGLSTLTAWSLNGSPREVWRVEVESAVALAATADGTQIVAASGQGVLTRRDARTGREIGRVAADGGRPVALTIDGERVYSLHAGGVVCETDLGTMTVLNTLAAPRLYSATQWAGAIAPKGAVAAMEYANGVETWAPETGLPASSLMGVREMAATRAVGMSPDARRVAVLTWMERGIHMFDRTDPGPYASLKPIRGARRLAFDASSNHLAIGTNDGNVAIFDLPTGILLRRLERGHGDIRGLGFVGSDAGRLVLASRVKDADVDEVEWWDLRSGELIRREAGFAGVRGLAVTIDGARVAYASEPRTVTLADASNAATVFRVETGAEIRTVGFSPDGRLVGAVVGGPEATSTDGVILWEVPSGRRVRTLAAPDIVLDAVVVFDDGRVVAGGANPALFEWPLTGASPVEHAGNATMAGIMGIALSPDGATVALSQTGPIRLTDAERLQDVLRLTDSVSRKHDGVFSPDGRYLVHATGNDGYVRRWDRLPARARVAGSAVRYWYDHHGAWPPVRAAVEKDPMLDDAQRVEALAIVERLAPWFDAVPAAKQ